MTTEEGDDDDDAAELDVEVAEGDDAEAAAAACASAVSCKRAFRCVSKNDWYACTAVAVELLLACDILDVIAPADTGATGATDELTLAVVFECIGVV